MADIYVRSTDGSDADNGSTWALAKATLAGALAIAAAGDTIFVSDNHAETQASAMTLTSPGTPASPCRILCVDDSAEPPTALATTATVTTTGNNAMIINGVSYVYGIAFVSGANITLLNTATTWTLLESCRLQLSGVGGNVILVTGAAGRGVTWKNVTLKFGAVSQGVNPSGRLEWNGGSIDSSGSAPTTLFQPTSSSFSGTVVGVDLSHLGSGKAIMSIAGSAPIDGTFIDCKLGSSVSFTTGTHAGQHGARALFINCDSADTNYRYHKQDYQGTITQETTIVRSGGLSDGTTAYSRKMVSTANSKLFSPLESQWFFVWNETTGSAITLTIPVLTDNVTLTDAEAWVEVEYMGTSGFPQGAFISDRVAGVLTTPANQPTDGTSSWVTTGLGTPVQQSLSVTFTPQEKGWIRARVVLARASTTVYVDKPILS